MPTKARVVKEKLPKTDYQLIMAARALINKPEKWIKGTNARDEFGKSVANIGNGSDIVKPVKHCAYGSIERVCWLEMKSKIGSSLFLVHERASKLMDKYFNKQDTVINLITLNDLPKTSHKKIMKVFTGAAKLAKKAELD